MDTKNYRYTKNKMYQSSAWKKLREKHLCLEPYCVKCKSTLNLQVDHIFEHKNNLSAFLDSSNLQTLCLHCHSHKSSLEYFTSRLKRGNWTLNVIAKENIKLQKYLALYDSNDEAIEKYVTNESFMKIINFKVLNLTKAQIRLALYHFYLRFETKPVIINIDDQLESSVKVLLSYLNN